MTPKPAIRIACSAALALAAGIALAQTPNPSFNLIGHIERFALTAPGDPLSAATMTVRGLYARIRCSREVSVPKALLLAVTLGLLAPLLAVLPADIEVWSLRRPP